jgi:hypothetical protein
MGPNCRPAAVGPCAGPPTTRQGRVTLVLGLAYTGDEDLLELGADMAKGRPYERVIEGL